MLFNSGNGGLVTHVVAHDEGPFGCRTADQIIDLKGEETPLRAEFFKVAVDLGDDLSDHFHALQHSRDITDRRRITDFKDSEGLEDLVEALGVPVERVDGEIGAGEQGLGLFNEAVELSDATTYERHSIDINRLVGDALCQAFPDRKVRMHQPDVTVYVNVVASRVYVYASSAVGVGGLPVGTAGKVVTLLSSGFDSPVAT